MSERYRSCLLINGSGDVVQREYVVTSPEIESSVSRCVVSQGRYPHPNSCTRFTDSRPREQIETHPSESTDGTSDKQSYTNGLLGRVYSSTRTNSLITMGNFCASCVEDILDMLYIGCKMLNILMVK